MAEPRPQDSDFNFATMDWKAYVAFRPVYPSSLYSTIYAYHDKHSGKYDKALDVGAGVGIVSRELLQKFSLVTISDASETYVAQARAQFASVPKDRVKLLQSKAEDLVLREDEKVDLITAAECLHWADLDLAISRIAEALKPGGTFAAWLYGVRPIFPELPDFIEAHEIFYEIYEKMKRQYDAQIEKQQTEKSGAAQMNSRFDCMEFDPEVWRDVRRMHARKDVPMAHAEWPSSPSRVREGERVEDFGDQALLKQEAGYEYLEGYLVNWIPPLNVPVLCKEELSRLKQAMAGRTVQITWPVVLVLATRR